MSAIEFLRFGLCRIIYNRPELAAGCDLRDINYSGISHLEI